MANAASADAETDAALAAAVCAQYGARPEALIEILLDIQERARCVSDAALAVVAEALNISRAEAHGVRSFYTDFSAAPKPTVLARICRAEACQALGADALARGVELRLGVETGAADGAVGVEAAYCLGNCALAPTAMVGERLIGRATTDKVVAEVKDAANG